MYACIDLGSNSFHLLIGEWCDGRIEIVERCSDKVQLGEGVRQTGYISQQAFQRGRECLERFSETIRSYPIKAYWALGTNTFRNAHNAAEFLQLGAELGIKISPISGVQEAVLVYAGVLSSFPANDEKRLVIDIGGGSTEVIVGQRHERLFTESLQIGSVAWRDQFFSGNNDSEAGLLAAMDEAAIQSEMVFSTSAAAVRKLAPVVAFASSGTSKMLATVCHSAGGDEGVIDASILQSIQSKLMQSIKDGEELSGVKERRRDLLLGSWGIMTGLMRTYEIERIVFSPTALREGMLDFMVKNKNTLAAMEGSNLPAVNLA